MIGAIAPVLRHVLTAQDNALFAETIIARLRGMLADIAGQLADAVHRGGAALGFGPLPDLLPDRLAASLAEYPALLCHLHAMAIEWQSTEQLTERIGLDPVLPPLLQALVASDEPATAEAAMKLLAAQARFAQTQRRMKAPLGELPGDVLHGVLQILRAYLAVLVQEGGGDVAIADTLAAQAEAQIRASYDESATRLGQISRLITALGGGALAALDLPHAGFAMFVTSLAHATTQRRDTCVLATQGGQLARLALSLRAAGLKTGQIEATLLALQPGAALPQDFDRLASERAAMILSRGPAPMTGVSAAAPGT